MSNSAVEEALLDAIRQALQGQVAPGTAVTVTASNPDIGVALDGEQVTV